MEGVDTNEYYWVIFEESIPDNGDIFGPCTEEHARAMLIDAAEDDIRSTYVLARLGVVCRAKVDLQVEEEN